jgi:hypothetical protein
LLLFSLEGGFDFGLDPGAGDGSLGEDEEELVVEANGFINAVAKFVADFQVFGGKPGADTVGLEIGVEAIGEVLVCVGIADAARVVFNGFAN